MMWRVDHSESSRKSAHFEALISLSVNASLHQEHLLCHIGMLILDDWSRTAYHSPFAKLIHGKHPIAKLR